MENKTYRTKDLHEAAFLLAKNQKLLQLQKERTGNYVWFVFIDTKGCTAKLANSYWIENATVKAKAYSDSLRSLKDRLFSQR